MATRGDDASDQAAGAGECQAAGAVPGRWRVPRGAASRRETSRLVVTVGFRWCPTRSGRVAGKAGVEFDVVASVAVAELGSFQALDCESGPASDSAGGRVVPPVPEFEPEQALVGQRPVGKRCGRGSCGASSACPSMVQYETQPVSC